MIIVLSNGLQMSLIALCVLVFVAAMSLTHLLGFHLMLALSGRTTYERILENRRQEQIAMAAAVNRYPLSSV